MTAPDYGIVVSVMSNTSDASLRGIAVELLQRFAEQKKASESGSP
jgi:hypothetical protein